MFDAVSPQFEKNSCVPERLPSFYFLIETRSLPSLTRCFLRSFTPAAAGSLIPVRSILKFRHLTSDLRPFDSLSTLTCHAVVSTKEELSTLNSQLAFRVPDSLPSLEGAENQVTLLGVPSQILAVAISDALAAAGRSSLIKQLQLNRFGCAVG